MTVEVSSINSRYTEVSVRTPRHLSSLEARAVEIVQSRVSRGKVIASVTLEFDTVAGAEGGVAITPNPSVARGYLDALKTLSDDLCIENTVSLETIARFPDVILVREPELDTECLQSLLEGVLVEALDELDAMREREGEALQRDMQERLETIAGLMAQVAERAPERVQEAKTRLEERIAKLVSSEVVDEQRLAMEIAVLADKYDVAEECTRMQSHLDQYGKIMREESAGRKLNFLLQEMNREANTIGSKSNDASMAHMVVEVKEEIERLREQVQNIE